MPLFPARYLSDEEIWNRISDLEEEREDITGLLSRPEVSTNPERMPDLARRLNELETLLSCASELREALGEREELEGLRSPESGEFPDPDYEALHRESVSACRTAAERLFRLLIEGGHLEEEVEDETDLRILRYIREMGPEYAWRLGVNIGIGEVEARNRLEVLRGKGLLERVQGTMLEGYHRQRDWVKHMNHTYYRLSRDGDHYLRGLRG